MALCITLNLDKFAIYHQLQRCAAAYNGKVVILNLIIASCRTGENCPLLGAMHVVGVQRQQSNNDGKLLSKAAGNFIRKKFAAIIVYSHRLHRRRRGYRQHSNKQMSLDEKLMKVVFMCTAGFFECVQLSIVQHLKIVMFKLQSKESAFIS